MAFSPVMEIIILSIIFLIPISEIQQEYVIIGLPLPRPCWPQNYSSRPAKIRRCNSTPLLVHLSLLVVTLSPSVLMTFLSVLRSRVVLPLVFVKLQQVLKTIPHCFHIPLSQDREWKHLLQMYIVSRKSWGKSYDKLWAARINWVGSLANGALVSDAAYPICMWWN